jgi:hypothetical protein
MRFLRLEVDAFQGIERATVEFGLNLNVLHGRNDLGKSTLVRAIRAALLVSPGSSEARAYVSWQHDRSPRVRLVFQDDDNRYWQVDKTFADGAHADLASSKDGVTFVNEAKAREVDERLRKILAWGVPLPGGKGAPRKMSASFLTRVLLAEQSDVDELLQEGIDEEDDNERRGPNRLITTLAALAEDPVFKRVLQSARREYDLYFTETGRKKTGQSSAFVKADEEVKKKQQEVAELEELVQRSQLTEDRLKTLRQQRDEEADAHQEAQDVLKTLEERRSRQGEREQRAAAHREALAALNAIDERAAQVKAADGQVAALEKTRADADAAVQVAAKDLEAATVAEAAAEKAYAQARDEGEQRRERRRQAITQALAELKSQQVELGHRKERLDRAAKAQEEVASARAALHLAESDLSFARRQETEATTKKTEAEREVARARALRAFGQWQQAVEAAQKMKAANAEAEALHARAHEADEQASAAEAGRVLGLPGANELKELTRLSREKENAEAALGGGLSIQVRPRKPIDLTVTLDGKASPATVAEQLLSVEAQRSVLLALGDQVAIEIQAGAPEQRRRAKDAGERWEREAVPLLRSLGAPDFEALVTLCEQAAEASARATRLRAEAETARSQAGDREAQASTLARLAEQVGAREAALAGQDRVELEKAFRKLGAGWEQQVDTLQSSKEKALAAAVDASHAVQLKIGTATTRGADCSRRVTQAEASLTEALGQAAVANAAEALEQLEKDLAALIANRAAREAELKALDSDAEAELAGLKKALEAASARRGSADQAHRNKATARDLSRDELSTATGRRDQLRAEWAKVDRPAAEALVKARAAALAELPNEAAVTDEHVGAARRRRDDAAARLEELKKELAKAEGVLEDSGGAVARERLSEVNDALAKARQAEEAVAVEADSWKLLKETLREVENEEGRHLGRTLAGPVGERFAEVTSGRYARLELGPRLKADGVGISGTAGAEVLEGLSVGTKDQLATLLRIVIAEELRSAIVLDDHLAHTDPSRLEWFRAALRRAASTTQVIVVTCRPTDYLAPEELAGAEPKDSGLLRTVNLDQVIRGWGNTVKARTAVGGT